MQSGLGGDDFIVDRNVTALYDILLPVLEKAMILAAKYARACERNSVTARDFQYGLKHCAMHSVGESIGSILPDDESDSGSDDSGEDFTYVDENDEPFTEYQGDDPLFAAVNESARKFQDWQPASPVECMLKKAIMDKLEDE